MNIRRSLNTRLWLLILIVFLIMPSGWGRAQGMDSTGPMSFRPEELDQMLAPIALYPDPLLSQILMAATYPLEVVEATRWIQSNPNGWGDPLAIALERKDWDPSVKSLVNFPAILQMMDERLDWTEMLGEAFLAEPDRVMDTIQNLRERAQAQGKLTTTSEQRIFTDPQTRVIFIEPINPQVIYVPVYDPFTVYGPWWWPGYPPFSYSPRVGVLPGRFVRFGAGVPFGVAWGYAWGGFDWHRHHIVVNSHRNLHLNPRIDRSRYGGPSARDSRWVWAHDPNHRRGMVYRNPAIARQFGRGPLPGVEARRGYRGYDPPPTGWGRPVLPPPRVTIGSPGGGPEPIRTPSAPARPRPEGVRHPPDAGPQWGQGLQGPPAFGGFAPGSQTRQNSHRGHESLSGARTGDRGPAGDKTGPGGGKGQGHGPEAGKPGPGTTHPGGGPGRDRNR